MKAAERGAKQWPPLRARTVYTCAVAYCHNRVSDFLSKNCAKINYEENVLQLKSEGKSASAQMIGNQRSEGWQRDQDFEFNYFVYVLNLF
jgi:hypothetical protein